MIFRIILRFFNDFMDKYHVRKYLSHTLTFTKNEKASDISASNTGNHQAKHGYFIGRSRYESSKSGKRLNHNGNQARHRNNGQMALKHIKSKKRFNRKRKHRHKK